jgi:hypothetical protein
MRAGNAALTSLPVGGGNMPSMKTPNSTPRPRVNSPNLSNSDEPSRILAGCSCRCTERKRKARDQAGPR